MKDPGKDGRPSKKLAVEGASSECTGEEVVAAVAYGEGEFLAPRQLTLRANFSWTLIGNVVYTACQGGILVVLTRLTSAEAVGRFATGLAVVTPVIMLSNLNLRAVQASDARREYVFGHYLALRLVCTLAGLAVIGAVAGFGRYRVETALTIMTVGLAKAAESISDVFYGLLQQRERMDRIAQSMMIKGPLSLIALGLTVYLTRSVVWGTAALAAAWAAVLLVYDLRSAEFVLACRQAADRTKALWPRYEWEKLLHLAWLAAPLGFVMMLVALNYNIPRYFIAHFLGEGQLGVFAAVSYLMVVGTTVVSALGQSAIPRLACHYVEGDKARFTRLLWRLVAVAAGLGVGGMGMAAAVGRPILNMLYGSEYAAHARLLVYVATAAAIFYVSNSLVYAMTAARRFRTQLFLFLLVAGCNAGVCLVAVPVYGLAGAALAVGVSSAVGLAVGAVIVAKALRRLDQGEEAP